MRVSFSVKIGIIIAVVSVGMTAGGMFFFYQRTSSLVISLMADRLLDVGRTSSYFFDKQAVADIHAVTAEIRKKGGDPAKHMAKLKKGETKDILPKQVSHWLMRRPEFQRLVQLLRRIKAASMDRMPPRGVLPRFNKADPLQPAIKFAYILISAPGSPDFQFGQWLADADYDTPDEEVDAGTLYHIPHESVRAAFRGRASAGKSFVNDKWGATLSSAFPVSDTNGSILAVVGLDMDVTNEANRLKDLWVVYLSVVGATILLALLATALITRQLTKPLAILRRGALRVAQRDFSQQIPVTRSDELGMMAEAFNTMVTEIRSYSEELEGLNRAYFRFVPKEFLLFLGRENIRDVQLGDQIDREMTVLFSDIRSFTTLSEGMSPKDNFDFINAYLQRVGPIIRNNNGFIDKYIGDAVMALFPGSPDDGVKAALEIRRELQVFNREWTIQGHPPIEIGIGLHTGKLMLGTIGESERMDSTVISDSVNLASRLEGLTKEMHAPILISDETRRRLEHPEEGYAMRFTGRVKVKGKQQLTYVYEILDYELDAAAARKEAGKELFERALRLYLDGKFGAAAERFQEIIQEFPEDKAAERYLEICRSRRGGGV